MQCYHCRRETPEYICHECQWSAISSPREARPGYVAAQEFLADLGLEVVRPPLSVSSTPPVGRVLRYSTQRSFAETGFAGLYSSVDGVWMMAGTPARVARSVLVHELTHAWQEANCPPQSLELTEGLAGWTEWHFLLSEGLDNLAVALYTNPCEVYGEGLRLCVRWAELAGADRMIEAVRTATNFPAWLRLSHGALSLCGL